VLSAVSTDSARQNFASFGDKLFESVGIFVIDKLNFVCAKTTGLATTGRRV